MLLWREKARPTTETKHEPVKAEFVDDVTNEATKLKAEVLEMRPPC
jgi:hypothetical protein